MANPFNEEYSRRMTRRQFVTLLGIGAAELTFRPLGNFIDFAARNGWLEEGHPAQRAATFERLLQTIELDPLSTKKRAMLIPWIKFNGAEAYAGVNQMPLTARTLRHFMYGNGETMDVGADFERALLNPNHKWSAPRGYRTIPYMVGRMINGTLNYAPNIKKESQEPFSISGDVRSYIEATRTNTPTHFKSSMVVYANEDEIDLRNSLNQHTLTIEGDQVKADRKPGRSPERPEFYEITLAHPSVSLYDRYDWTAGTKFGGEGNIQDVALATLEQMGVQKPSELLIHYLGQEGYGNLRNHAVRIDDEDGVFLTNYGFGHEFDITGKLNVGDTLQFEISTETLEKALRQ
jgi:hypothetical protein